MAYPRRFLFGLMGETKGRVNMVRITICLKDFEKIALRTLAEKEFREPRDQAALIIRDELTRRGLLPQAQIDLTRLNLAILPADFLKVFDQVEA